MKRFIFLSLITIAGLRVNAQALKTIHPVAATSKKLYSSRLKSANFSNELSSSTGKAFGYVDEFVTLGTVQAITGFKTFNIGAKFLGTVNMGLSQDVNNEYGWVSPALRVGYSFESDNVVESSNYMALGTDRIDNFNYIQGWSQPGNLSLNEFWATPVQINPFGGSASVGPLWIQDVYNTQFSIQGESGKSILKAYDDQYLTAFEIANNGNVFSRALNVSGVANINTGANADNPALVITGNEPDIVFNQTKANGFSTFTWKRSGATRLAFGMNGADDFYLTRNVNGTWNDNTFRVIRNNGNVLVGKSSDNGVDKLQVDGSIEAKEIKLLDGSDLNFLGNGDDTGDLVFKNGSGIERGRLWFDSGNKFYVRFDSGAAHHLWHSGNVAELKTSLGLGSSAYQSETLQSITGRGSFTNEQLRLKAVSSPNPNSSGADKAYNSVGFYSDDLGNENSRIESFYHNEQYVDRGGLKFYTRGGDGLSSRLTILSNGNVGVGTISPESKLEVKGNVDIKYSSSDEYFLRHKDLSNNILAGFKRDGNSLLIRSFDGVKFTTGNQEQSTAMSITATGKVGIGTVNPNGRLSLGNGVLNRKLVVYDGGTEASGLGQGASEFRIFGIDGGSNHISFGKLKVETSTTPETFTEQMRISHNGNIGVGTSTPENSEGWDRVLDVNGSGHSKIIATTSTVQTGMWSHNNGYFGAETGGMVGTNSNHPFSIITNKTVKMTIKSNGFVGIGLNNPTEALTVNGNILTKGIKVNPELVPDYVFKPQYKLPSLKDVESYVKENSHLPEVPSEAEVKKNGLELGEMSVILLKKVEELTLYMIEKDKQLEKANQRIEELSKKVDKLSKK